MDGSPPEQEPIVKPGTGTNGLMALGLILALNQAPSIAAPLSATPETVAATPDEPLPSPSSLPDTSPVSHSFTLNDWGRDLKAPVALLVETPGIGGQAYQVILEALEQAGLDAWSLQFGPLDNPPAQHWAVHLATRAIPVAVQQLKARDRQARRRLLLLGHGMGGVMMLMAIPELDEPPRAVAALGSPLEPAPSELLEWLDTLDTTLPTITTDMDPSWKGQTVSSLLWGSAPPPREPLPTRLALEYLDWLLRGHALPLESITCPVLLVAGAMDRLAPPESIRMASHRLPDSTFLRLGMLHLDWSDPSHGDLIQDRRNAELVADWLRQEVEP